MLHNEKLHCWNWRVSMLHWIYNKLTKLKWKCLLSQFCLVSFLLHQLQMLSTTQKSSTTAQYSLLNTESCSASCSGFYLKCRHCEVLKNVSNDLQFHFLAPYLPFTLNISKTHSHGQQVLIASKSWQRLWLASGLGCAHQCSMKI